ncbi:MAG: hypothetical protein COA78_06065 [Blastopirellula sp.]|nr:MAG: hypothetical protein COA78_06065 [Blastopirellula sp.]
MKKVILGILLLSIVIFAGSWYFYKTRKQYIQTLTSKAELAERNEQWIESEKYMRQLLEYRSLDSNLNYRIGLAIHKSSNTHEDRLRSLPFFAKAFEIDPSLRNELGLAETLVVHDPKAAIQHAKLILQQDPDNLNAKRIRILARTFLLDKGNDSKEEIVSVWNDLIDIQQTTPHDFQIVRSIIRLLREYRTTLITLLEVNPNEIAWNALDELVKGAKDEVKARTLRVQNSSLAPDKRLAQNTINQDIKRLLELRPESRNLRRIAAGLQISRTYSRGSLPNQAHHDDTKSIINAIDLLSYESGRTSPEPIDYHLIAQLKYRSTKFKEALDSLEQASSQSGSKNLLIQLRLAEVAITLEKWSQAEDSLKSLSNNIIKGNEAGQIWSLNELLWAQWYLAFKNPQYNPRKAMSHINRCDESTFSGGIKSLAIYLKGQCWYSMDQWSLAEKEFSKVCLLSQESAIPHISLALVKIRQGKIQDAGQIFKTALSLITRSDQKFKASDIIILIVRCCLIEQQNNVPWVRDWKEFDQALDATRRNITTSLITDILELESYRAGRPLTKHSTIELFERDLEDRHISSQDFWFNYAKYHQHHGNIKKSKEAYSCWKSLSGETNVIFEIQLLEAEGEFLQANALLLENAESFGFENATDMMIWRARLLEKSGNNKDAFSLLETSHSSNRSQIKLLFETGELAWRTGNINTLADVLNKLSQHNDISIERINVLHTRLAFLRFLRLPNKETSKSLLNCCHKLSTSELSTFIAFTYLGLASEEIGHTSNAISYYRKAISLGETNPLIRLRLAKLLAFDGQHYEAFNMCVWAAESDYEYLAGATLCVFLQSDLFSPSETRRAEEIFTRLLSRSHGDKPKIAIFLSNLSSLREKENKYQEAVSLAIDALQMEPESVILKNNLALMLVLYTDQNEEAMKLIDAALLTAGNNHTLLDTKGVILLKNGKPELAVNYLRESISGSTLTPDSRIIHLADALVQLGKFGEAKEQLDVVDLIKLTSISSRDRQTFVRLSLTLRGSNAIHE